MNVTVDGKLSDSRIIDVKGNDKKREFILENLCCANCASKIESRVKNIPEIKTAYLDFLSKKLIVQLEDEQKLDYVVKKNRKYNKYDRTGSKGTIWHEKS